MHVLSNIVGDLYIKSNKEQNIMAEDNLKNKIIFGSGSSIDIFINNQLVAYINRSNQVLHASNGVG